MPDVRVKAGELIPDECIQQIVQHLMELVCIRFLCLLGNLFHYRGCLGHDRMVVGFTTTCAISAYHH